MAGCRRLAVRGGEPGGAARSKSGLWQRRPAPLRAASDGPDRTFDGPDSGHRRDRGLDGQSLHAPGPGPVGPEDSKQFEDRWTAAQRTARTPRPWRNSGPARPSRPPHRPRRTSAWPRPKTRPISPRRTNSAAARQPSSRRRRRVSTGCTSRRSAWPSRPGTAATRTRSCGCSSLIAATRSGPAETMQLRLVLSMARRP